MFSSLYVPKRHVLVPILAVVAIQLLFMRSVSSMNMTNAYLHHICFASQGKYKPGSAYEDDLKDLLIDTIPKFSNFSRGYEMMSINLPASPDYISGTIQCRGDTHGPKCRSCYTTAHIELRKRCPYYKGGIIWYDLCFLYISTIDTLGELDYKNNYCMSNNAKKLNPEHYTNVGWLTFIDNLTTIATHKKTPTSRAVNYAVGERRIGKHKVYGMVQCTEDMSSKGCEECVRHNMLHFQECLYFKRGGRVLGKSCNVRYEFYPFAGAKAGSKYLKI